MLERLLVAGTSACIADAMTFPLDTAKVRLQVSGQVSRQVLSAETRSTTDIGLYGPWHFRLSVLVGPLDYPTTGEDPSIPNLHQATSLRTSFRQILVSRSR